MSQSLCTSKSLRPPRESLMTRLGMRTNGSLRSALAWQWCVKDAAYERTANHNVMNNHMNDDNNNNRPVGRPQGGRGVTAHERPVVRAVLQQGPEARVLEGEDKCTTSSKNPKSFILTSVIRSVGGAACSKMP